MEMINSLDLAMRHSWSAQPGRRSSLALARLLQTILPMLMRASTQRRYRAGVRGTIIFERRLFAAISLPCISRFLQPGLRVWPELLMQAAQRGSEIIWPGTQGIRSRTSRSLFLLHLWPGSGHRLQQPRHVSGIHKVGGGHLQFPGG